MGTIINKFQDRLEEHLRRVCVRMSPLKRVVVVMTMLLVFTGMSFYFIISSIYHYGKGEGTKLQIEHIESLQLELDKVQTQLDSVKTINDFDYDYFRQKK